MHFAFLKRKKRLLISYIRRFIRYNATDDDIKRAYRKCVLKHHPDKRKAQGEHVDSDTDYFTCITKAYEILGIFNIL